MGKTKNNLLEKLKLFYLFTFILTAILVLPAHLFPPPLFMPLRFPHYLEMMRPFLGISWPITFNIYHLVLLILAIIGSFNILGIVFFPKWRLFAQISSSAGICMTTLMVLFFLFLFTKVNVSTAIIYGIYSLLLFILSLITFFALLGDKKMKKSTGF